MIDSNEIRRRQALFAQGYWVIPENLDVTGFDFNWRPESLDVPYIHQFGTQWQKTGGPQFVVPESQGIKYRDEQKARHLPAPENFNVIGPYTVEFDWSWHPDATEPEFIWTFGNQYIRAEKMPTVEFKVGTATNRKYVNDLPAKLVSTRECWRVHGIIDETKFDLTWHPDPREPAWIYVWGNQYFSAEEMPTVEYYQPGATERKYVTTESARLTTVPEFWKIYDDNISPVSCINTWAPHPWEPPWIYVWGNKWIPAEKQATLEYHVPGATQRKYMSELVDVVPEQDRWHVLVSIDTNSFDFSWRPDPAEPPWIYVWGNQWLTSEQMPTVEYHVPGATQRKYITDQYIKLANDPACWRILDNVNKQSFDFTWAPHPYDPPMIYVWGNKWIPAEKQATLEYHVPGATLRKYMTELVDVVPEHDRWTILTRLDETRFDFSWRPDPSEPAYIYVWGNKWISAEKQATLEYHMPGATQRKYMSELVDVVPEHDRWRILSPIDETRFDFSWRPDPSEPAYIYVWGNKWIPAEKQATLEYHVPGATLRKYMSELVDVVPERDRWRILSPIDETRFDFSWRHDPSEPAYIYVWGNPWVPVEKQATLEYHVPGASERKYMSELVDVLPEYDRWNIIIPANKPVFDFSWRPDPSEPPLIYVWGNQWNDATTEPTLEYCVPGATERKYITDTVVTLPAAMENWTVNNSDDLETFDFSWRPNPHSPAQIYQWENAGPTYTVPGATAVVLMKRDPLYIINKPRAVPRYYLVTGLDDLVQQHPNEVFWALNPDLNYDSFDFSWEPSAENFSHVNAFGNDKNKDPQIYYINGPLYKLGRREINYINYESLAIETKLDMFYVDCSSVDDELRYQELKQRYPDIQRTRYLNSWVDTITRCIKKAQSRLIWVLSSEVDYSDFKFDFYPSKWQMKQVHVFGSQWNHWANTYMINTETFPEDTKYVKVIEHLGNINHVRNQKITVVGCKYDIIYIDHGNPVPDSRLELLTQTGKTVYTVPYQASYLKTLASWLDSNKSLTMKKELYLWVTSSVCDYSDFDFSWHCDPFQRDQIHVFPSKFGRSKQLSGDTFLINMLELNKLIAGATKLTDSAFKLNYVAAQTPSRLPHPVIQHDYDSQVDAIKNIIVDSWPYYELINSANVVKPAELVPDLWDSESRTILTGTPGAGQVLVPASAVSQVQQEVYDYPWIETSKTLGTSRPIDIVFVSNGEPAADRNFDQLTKISRRLGLKNKIVRVNQVVGRTASQQAAAQASDTDWYFLVNGKLQVNSEFDWGWQPDRLQQPKHYIFTALNPVNGLEYGHQAIVANNKKLTLNTVPRGLDFTLDSPHDVVEINSGIALYNTDPWTTWRTAFRESIKLYNSMIQFDDPISATRLESWLGAGHGDYADYSQAGAQAGVEYYKSVNGELDKLMLTYDWAWILEYYRRYYQE